MQGGLALWDQLINSCLLVLRRYVETRRGCIKTELNEIGPVSPVDGDTLIETKRPHFGGRRGCRGIPGEGGPLSGSPTLEPHQSVAGPCFQRQDVPT